MTLEYVYTVSMISSKADVAVRVVPRHVCLVTAFLWARARVDVWRAFCHVGRADNVWVRSTVTPATSLTAQVDIQVVLLSVQKQTRS